MPRAKPPEELFLVNYRLTRRQIRKVQEMGGVGWLRKLISDARTSRQGLDPVPRIRLHAKRNADIVNSPASSRSLADFYNLSVQCVNRIRREHREL